MQTQPNAEEEFKKYVKRQERAGWKVTNTTCSEAMGYLWKEYQVTLENREPKLSHPNIA